MQFQVSLLSVVCICAVINAIKSQENPSPFFGDFQKQLRDIQQLIDMSRKFPAVSRVLRSTTDGSGVDGVFRAVTSGNYSVSTLATVAGVFVGSVAVAAFYYPEVLQYMGFQGTARYFGDESNMTRKIEQILRRYNIDGDACLKVALCSVGKISASNNLLQTAQASASSIMGKEKRETQPTPGPVDVLDTMLSLSYVEAPLREKGLRQARDVGRAGGDCDAAFNPQAKCPFTASAWRILLTTINRAGFFN